MLSLQWFAENYGNRTDAIPVIFARKAIAERRADFPEGTRVVTDEKATLLMNALAGLWKGLVNEPLLYRNAKQLGERIRALTRGHAEGDDVVHLRSGLGQPPARAFPAEGLLAQNLGPHGLPAGGPVDAGHDGVAAGAVVLRVRMAAAA